MLVAPTELRHAPFKALTRDGRGSNIPEDHGVDFLFYAHTRAYGIQRKELGDFIASVHDGRLHIEVGQMAALTQALVIIEGTPRWSLDGELVDHRFGQPWRRSSHLAHLWGLQARGIMVAGTTSVTETAIAISLFEQWVKKEKHRAFDTRPGPSNVWGSATNKDFQRHLIMGVRGIGPELADAIIAAVGVPFTLSVPDADLLAIPGVGPKTVQRLKEALGA